MLRKMTIIAMIFMILLGSISLFNNVQAVTGNQVLESDQATEMVELKENTKGRLQKYIDMYGSTPYGVAAYVLNIIRIYSIPFCFLGIAIGSVYQYVLGIRKLDVRDKGFMLIITFVTILLICQVLPLIFAVVVNGWRG